MGIKKKELMTMLEYVTGKVTMLEERVAGLECVKPVTLEEVREFDISAYKKHNETSSSTVENDNVNHPSHYTDGKYEVIDFIEQYGFSFHVGNAVKYICRAGKKDEDCYIEDLKKARWYLSRWHNHLLNDGRDRYIGDRYPTDRINVTDFCKDKKLSFELTKAINFIVLGQFYQAYLEVDKYVKWLEEMGEEPKD